ncbi:TetR/AcrR family transcriptional regulator [Paenibacillus sp. NPDC058071]|uniref:TetR/AcrR family transcriptional regulator n=1 Tax=Paenibacillus sp. NPDC058071 TaxID=3346326 RepID=UPI0036DF3913
MTPPSAASTAERIQEAALRMFGESGYEGTSLSEIAKEVGIKTPSIYAHFSSKEQLFIQLCDASMDEERQSFLALLNGSRQESGLARLYKAFDFFTAFNHLTAGVAFLKRAMLVPPRHLRDRLRIAFFEYETELSGELAKLIVQGRDEGEITEQNTDTMLAQFYNAIDGLLVENQLYDVELFEERRQIVRKSLAAQWTRPL